MSLEYSKALAEDLNVGVGSVTVTSPAGGTMTGNKIALSTFGGPLVASHYAFTAQTPGTTLTGGVGATVTLTPVPVGVAGADVGHYLYISGGTGTAEAVLITGGTATSGATTGTVTFTPANNHSGAWTIASATGGVQEAVSVAVATPKSAEILIDTPVTFYQKLSILNYSGDYISLVIRGRGIGDPAIVRGSSYSTGDLILIDGTSGTTPSTTLIDMLIVNAPITGLWTVSGGSSVHYKACGTVPHHATNVQIYGAYVGFEVDCNNVWFDGCRVLWHKAYLDEIAPSAGFYYHASAAGNKPTANWNTDCHVYGDITATNKANYGILVTSADGISISGFHGGQTNYGIGFIQSTDIIAHVQIVNSNLDWFSISPLIIYSAGSAVIWDILISNSHIAGYASDTPAATASHGININSTSLEYFIVSGCDIYGCGGDGISVTATGLKSGIITGNRIWANNTLNGSRVGIYVGAATGNISIVGNDLQRISGQSWDLQTTGISCDAASTIDTLEIVGNNLSGNTTATLALHATKPTKAIIKDNLGIDNIIGSVSSGATIVLPLNPIIKITGTTQITTISGGWTGRKATLIFTDAAPGGFGTGGNVICAMSTRQNQSIALVYDGTNWYPNDVCDSLVTVASSATIALGLYNTVKITGTTQITTITGGWVGRQVVLIFTNAAPGGLATGGNIVLGASVAQNQSVLLISDGTNWYPINGQFV